VTKSNDQRVPGVQIEEAQQQQQLLEEGILVWIAIWLVWTRILNNWVLSLSRLVPQTKIYHPEVQRFFFCVQKSICFQNQTLFDFIFLFNSIQFLYFF
jgi:hypothetical protein